MRVEPGTGHRVLPGPVEVQHRLGLTDEHIVLLWLRHVALPFRGRRAFTVFEELGGIGAGEQVYYPVGEHPCPVEVVAELVEVNTLPDQRADPTTGLCAKDVDEGAVFPQVDELAQGAVTEGHRHIALILRYEVERRPLAFLLGSLGEGGNRRTLVVNSGAVSHGVDPGSALHAQELIDENSPAVILLHVEALHERRGLDSCGPHRCTSRNGASIREHHGAGSNLFGFRIVDDLYPL